MEKTSDDFINLISILPSEIQQEIASYLDTPSLSFFAQSHKQILKNILPLLIKHQAKLPLLRLAAKGESTYFYQTNQLFVCGSNGHCQLGLGDRQSCATFTTVPWPAERGKIQQVSAGENYTIVLTENNRLWGCGANTCGQLGLGYEGTYLNTFKKIQWPKERGQIQQVVTGGFHSIVLTEDNRLWVCGNNGSGQLGLNDIQNRFTFSEVEWPENRSRIRQVIAGEDYTIVLTKDNRLWVCGDNNSGQLGLGDQVDRAAFTEVEWPENRGRIRQVIASENYTIVLTENNRLWWCGANTCGQLGLGDYERRLTITAVPWSAKRGKIQQIIAGKCHTVILTEDNRLWVCGDNYAGQLGLGDRKILLRLTFTTVPWPADRGKIQQVIAAERNTFVLTQDNRLWVCGDNDSGQLGLGDQVDRAAFTPVKILSKAMQQVFILNQLVKFGLSESDSQHLLKKPGCNLQ